MVLRNMESPNQLIFALNTNDSDRSRVLYVFSP